MKSPRRNSVAPRVDGCGLQPMSVHPKPTRGWVNHSGTKDVLLGYYAMAGLGLLDPGEAILARTPFTPAPDAADKRQLGPVAPRSPPPPWPRGHAAIN